MSEVTVDIALPVAAQPSLNAIVELGERAEELGYNRLWLPETWGRDAVTTLATIADHTDEIGISNSVFPVYSRSPALIGQTAATLDEASDGRYRVGLGASSPIVIENWHGADFERPLRRIREYVDVVKRVLSGETVDYGGDFFDLSGFRLRCEPPETPPAVDLAVMGPKGVELAGRFADGWQAIVYTPDGLTQRMDDLHRGIDLGDRQRDDVRVTLGQTCCALDDAERARELVVQHTAFYLGGMGTYYRDALAREGYKELAHDIYDAWQADDRDRAKQLVAANLMEEVPAGTPAEARECLEAVVARDEVDAMKVAFPRGATIEEIHKTMDALAPGTSL
ncbi:TIGR04024 family LLM class F420-dependent oxidoreductase [Natrinema sp. 74]|uniref:TIGR04024 family LLM class F420-dependent oxidoreductase n=1 Tax=Natrinema sp. 74 TaxID=3384159 RepID=UPI0038D4295B